MIINQKLELKENDTALKYSEKPEELKQLMSEISIEVKEETFRKNETWGDTSPRITLNVVVTRGKRSIDFNFGMSIRDSLILKANQGQSREEGTELYKVLSPGWKRITIWDAENAWKKVTKTMKQSILDDILYSILCCIRSEFYCPRSFKSFCGELGYNDDSIKDKALFERCQEQAERLSCIFNGQEIECLPS